MTLELVVTIATVFVAVALLSGGLLSYGLSLSSERRLRDSLAPRKTGIVRSLDENIKARAERWDVTSFLAKSEAEVAATRGRLALAGFQRPSAAGVFSTIEWATAALFGVIPMLVLGFKGGWLLGGFGGFIGFMIPGLLLGRLIKRRKKQVADGLPDVLDLLVLCLEAGSSMDQALMKATEDLRSTYPILADELRLVTTEIRAGKQRTEAFKSLADRTKVDDVRALVSILAQTDRFGTSVAQAMRTQAVVGRTKRRQRAEERAARVGVKLVFPLVFCLFPALYVVMLGPAVIKLARIFETH